MRIDVQRRLAIAELLSQSDPPDLQGRGYRLRLEGKPERYALLPYLTALFVQQKLLALEERRKERCQASRIVSTLPLKLAPSLIAIRGAASFPETDAEFCSAML